MRTDLSLTSRSQEIPQAPNKAEQPPSLWQGLEGARQQQLAQCLATLLWRMHCATLTGTEESEHEPS